MPADRFVGNILLEGVFTPHFVDLHVSHAAVSDELEVKDPVRFNHDTLHPVRLREEFAKGVVNRVLHVTWKFFGDFHRLPASTLARQWH